MSARNGWYWRIAWHPTLPGVIEVRRAEDGIRTWEAQPGEYYHSFNGEYGGLWRRLGRPPNVMCGVGFTAQGFDVCSYYVRKEGSFDPRAAFIFEGVGPDERIGDFGLVGGGAAGLELDRVELALGSPPQHAAAGELEAHTDLVALVNEEFTVVPPNLTGLAASERARRPRLLRDRGGRCGVLDRLDRLVRLALAPRLRQQRRAHHRQRDPPLPRSGTVHRVNDRASAGWR